MNGRRAACVSFLRGNIYAHRMCTMYIYKYMYILCTHTLVQQEQDSKRENRNGKRHCYRRLDAEKEKKDALTSSKDETSGYILLLAVYRLRARGGIRFRMIFQGTESRRDFLRNLFTAVVIIHPLESSILTIIKRIN